MIPIVLITGEPLAWRWLLMIPALILQTFFALGLALIVARIGAKIPDTSQVLPFILRTWLYMSGVFYNIDTFAKGHADWVKQVLHINPGAVFIDLVRDALLTKQAHLTDQWGLAAAWGVGMLVVGYAFFWQAEEQYGRV
jgi:teichoic acid transport system permease protein